jgi:hypothetical protein
VLGFWRSPVDSGRFEGCFEKSSSIWIGKEGQRILDTADIVHKSELVE